MTQLQLAGMHSLRVIRAAPDRESPAIWVRALRVVRELSDAPDHVVREVRLRRGLNIVWAPPQGARAGVPNADASIAGHTAGKTSFIRLLRYVLGDRHFGSKAVRDRVRERLPHAHVLAEVEVAGETWGVVRPLCFGSHPFSVRGAGVDQILSTPGRGEFREYLDALAAATLSALPATRFPDGDSAISWEHLLQWLTRDQECRFSDIAEWRHPASASEAPSLTSDERHFLLRSVLDLVTDAEREEQERNARLVVDRKRLIERRPLLEYQGRTDTERLRRLLGVDVPPGEGLFSEAGVALVRERQAEVTRQQRAVASAAQARDEALQSRDLAIVGAAGARRDVLEAERLADLQERALGALDDRQAGKAVVQMFADLPPGSDYCSVPLSEARAQRCPLVTSRTVELDERRAARSAPEERAAQAAIVESHRREVGARRSALAAAEAHQRAENGKYVRAQTTYDGVRGTLAAAEAALREVERLVSLAATSWRDAEGAAEEESRLSAEIKASYDQQEALRAERAVALSELSTIFEHVIHALLGPAVQGRVEASGRSLALYAERNGDRDSAALATAKLLAFDLAALTASIEGRGAFPRFLVHDGPREADLALDIYQRLFEYARALESIADGEPAFQYVITTTTEPPEHLRREPWLRLLLSGADGESRLYGMDL